MKALMKTRDQLELGTDYTEQSQLISLDFNDDPYPNRSVQGIEIVVPEDANKHTVEQCQLYCTRLQRFFGEYGVLRNLRNEPTKGVLFRKSISIIYTEPFFADDKDCLDIICRSTYRYCMLIRETLGEIENAVFIQPHTQADPGASTKDGRNERGLAKYVILPELMDIFSQEIKYA